MKLDGVTVYNTIKVLKVAREKEAKKQTANPNRPRGRPRKRLVEELEKENEEEILKTPSSDLEIILDENLSY